MGFIPLKHLENAQLWEKVCEPLDYLDFCIN